MMRVTNKSLNESVIMHLNSVSSDLFRAHEVVSSGKRINRLSDDPVGLVSVLNLRSSLANLDQLDRNLGAGRSWLDAGESALNQVEMILSEAKSLCVQMGSATIGSAERSNATAIVEGYLQQILALANTQVGGRFIFGGTRTDIAPFDLSDDGEEVVYRGNENPFSIKIGKNMDLAVGRNGKKVFGDDDFDWSDPGAGHDNVFKTLMDLKGHLALNDTESVRETLSRLDGHLENMRAAISDTGAKVLRLDTKESIIQDLKLGYTERMSGIEDCDIAEAIMILKSKELAYEAALASSSRVMQLSLVNYL
jgi:flagellar hook-associated protein 3 FlgL